MLILGEAYECYTHDLLIADQRVYEGLRDDGHSGSKLTLGLY